MPDINHHEGLSGTGLSDIFRAEGTPTPHVSPHGSNTQVKQVIEHTAGPLLVSPRSFSTPIISSTSPEQPRRPSRKHDPYSSLTALERDIILCIKTASTQHAKESIYPSMGTSRHREAAWKGLQFSVIVAVISSQHPTLSPEELQSVEYTIVCIYNQLMFIII
ncbi:hypothetical protein BDZ94DRAFT_467249 [Collybia nuda]|uniref:Uncharacterized protein n=1 Tax=Collybia nuda TaxID=64659 RepID=A0A9P6CG72_9AGAR|nr:hypothetical protein BDZ94DRAFT_467249 [Collybia nuda]